MEHKAGLRARFVRNSIGGGSHDPRNWIGCVSRREETTTRHGIADEKQRRERERDDLIAVVCADMDRESVSIRWIIKSCRSRMTNHRPAKVDESANIGFL